MKKTNRIFLGVGLTLSLATLTGCIEETFPLSSMATEEQVQESPTSTEAMALGMPAKALSIWDDASWHSFFGLPAHMIIRDMMTGDYCQNGSGIGYGWNFYYWAQNKNMGDGLLKTQFTWNFYWGFLLSVNNVIGAVNPDNATDEQLGYLGSALAYRALIYLDLARMYEFLPNDIFTKNDEGVDVTNLTVPWVDENTTSAQASNNPRLPRAEMFAKILADLDNAEKYAPKLGSTQGQTQADLACVYGLKARAYMWVEDYENAEKYARKAIDETKPQPLTEARALDTKAGYNTAADFMWALQLDIMGEQPEHLRLHRPGYRPVHLHRQEHVRPHFRYRLAQEAVGSSRRKPTQGPGDLPRVALHRLLSLSARLRIREVPSRLG